MSPDPLRIFNKEQWPHDLFNTWRPNDYDLKVVRTRIEMKIKLKPDWYKWNDKKITTI